MRSEVEEKVFFGTARQGQPPFGESISESLEIMWVEAPLISIAEWVGSMVPNFQYHIAYIGIDNPHFR